MPKAFWMFARNVGNGTNENPSRPGVPDSLTTVGLIVPGDIVRLQTAYSHRHLLIGGFAIADDNLDGQTGDGHTHQVVYAGGNWQQVTSGWAHHDHPLRTASSGMMLADWFLCFCTCSNDDAVAINASPDCFPIVEAELEYDEDDNVWDVGDMLSVPWTSAERTLWEARCLEIIGFRLPPEVDRGKRLVMLFLGALLSRQSMDDLGYRIRRVQAPQETEVVAATLDMLAMPSEEQPEQPSAVRKLWNRLTGPFRRQ